MLELAIEQHIKMISDYIEEVKARGGTKIKTCISTQPLRNSVQNHFRKSGFQVIDERKDGVFSLVWEKVNSSTHLNGAIATEAQ